MALENPQRERAEEAEGFVAVKRIAKATTSMEELSVVDAVGAAAAAAGIDVVGTGVIGLPGTGHWIVHMVIADSNPIPEAMLIDFPLQHERSPQALLRELTSSQIRQVCQAQQPVQ
jgi:hypothetical protein